jgi:hypothetical protein
MNRSDIESFFKTLILGDFDENPNTAAYIVGGIISLIPIVDQVMDVRDVSGALYRINAQGGFDNATSDQLVNLGFAAFGCIPEVGSAFKTVFKPLWRERRAAKSAVNGGVEAVERLLGMKKGGAIVWMRVKLLGNWASHTQQAIAKVNLALDACIELLDTIGHLKGWKDYLVPDGIQKMALELLPSMRAMKGGVSGALQKASDEIRHFLEDLLGEQAAAVVMAAGERAVMQSAMPGARARTGHNAAAAKPRGAVQPRQADRKTAGQPTTNASKGAGAMHTARRVTSDSIKEMARRQKGLVGEHMADYFEMKRLSGGWTHDNLKSTWSPSTVSKLNTDQRPITLRLIDLPKVNQSGMDAIWVHGGKYTVTEAKAGGSVATAYSTGRLKQKEGRIPKVGKLTTGLRLLHYLLTDYEDKQGGAAAGMMQMSKTWCSDRAPKEKGVADDARKAITRDRCDRRVLFVSFESEGAVDHAEALIDINAMKDDKDVHPHVDHGVTKEWGKTQIDEVDDARTVIRERAKVAVTGTPEEQASAAKPGKAGKGRKK